MRASLLSFVAFDTLIGASGFAPIAPAVSFVMESPMTELRARRHASGADNDDDADDFDVDQVRQRLEALVGSSSTDMNMMARRQESLKANVKSMLLREKTLFLEEEDPIDFDLDRLTQPPLTSIERERRVAEMHLLSQLDDGDQGLSDLWTHWFQERGANAAARLLQAEELTARGPRSWGEAEIVLRSLIRDYGVYWVEPVNRLATLYFMQGKLRESEALSKIVLKIKPWHFGALSGIVMVYAGLQDAESARMWAARRMPTFAPKGANRRRSAWVERAVRDASKSLDDAEKRLMLSFGKPDPRVEPSPDAMSTDDAWQ